jgi:hypothetical protein
MKLTTGTRTCIICGKTYEFCGKCGGKKKVKDTWKYLYDTKECELIMTILSKYHFGYMTKDEARKALSDLKVQCKKFTPENQAQIDEIFSTPKDKPNGGAVQPAKNDQWKKDAGKKDEK